MSKPENSTALHDILPLVPGLLFPNKHSNKRSALEKDTITSEPTNKFSGLSKIYSDEGICDSDNIEILGNADERPNECAIASKTLKQKGHFTRHKCTHMVEKQCKCSVPVGGKKSTENSVAIEHKRVDSREKSFECSDCGNIFANFSILSRHKRIHSLEKPYECSECGKKYSALISLCQHKRIHSGEKLYECSECGKRFLKHSAIIRHKLIHSGEKPYECSQCGKKFSQHSALITHKRIHSGEKPYECSECGKKFIRNCDLTTHKRIVTLLHTNVFTLEKSHLNVQNVERHLVSKVIYCTQSYSHWRKTI